MLSKQLPKTRVLLPSTKDLQHTFYVLDRISAVRMGYHNHDTMLSFLRRNVILTFVIILVTFVFLGVFRRGLSDFYSYLDMRDSFEVFDKDGNGVLDSVEVKEALHRIVPKENAEEIVSTGVVATWASEATETLPRVIVTFLDFSYVVTDL